MCTYNEGEWVEPSMLSVKDFVDEYVVVDSSSDGTSGIFRRVAAEEGLNIKLFRVPPGDLAMSRLISLKNSSYKWILNLDADTIFYEDGGR
ncbi:MAG: glycosyltransferase family A protein [Sulfolobales archaeon]